MSSSANSPWQWLEPSIILAVHDEQLAEHGGAASVRDRALLESALGRAQHVAAYGNPDLFDLAAAYGYGLAKNRPFVDGNKRTAFVAVELFLSLHATELTADDAACVATFLSLAAGDLDEKALAAWLRRHSAPPADAQGAPSRRASSIASP